MRFFDRHQAEKDRFAILAFHEPGVKDFAELDQKLAPVVAKRWNGRTLPFPILLDSTGETVEKWRISSFPTTVLIDPQGRLIGESSEEELEAALQQAAGR